MYASLQFPIFRRSVTRVSLSSGIASMSAKKTEIGESPDPEKHSKTFKKHSKTFKNIQKTFIGTLIHSRTLKNIQKHSKTFIGTFTEPYADLHSSLM